MRAINKNTWKSKIDPAFDEYLKQYLNILRSCNLPSNKGYIIPVDRALNVFEQRGYPALDKEYDQIIELGENIKSDLLSLGGIKNISKITRNSHVDFKKELLDPLEYFPEGESKRYYARKFAKFMTAASIKEYFKGMSQEKLIDEIKELIRDVQSMYFNIAMSDSKSHTTTKTHKAGKIRKSVEFRIYKDFMASINNTISMLVNKKTITTLIDEAKKGNDKALYRAIRVDKTLLDAKWIRKRIRVAQYLGEYKFFEQLGDAIKKSPLEHDMEHTQSFLVLAFFWRMGLYRLTNSELMELLTSVGIKIQDDPLTFRKFVGRLKKGGVLST
jgi:hypothetical protein